MDGRWDGEGGREGERCNRTPLGGQLLLRRAAVVAETEFRQFTTAATQTPSLLTSMLRPRPNLVGE